MPAAPQRYMWFVTTRNQAVSRAHQGDKVHETDDQVVNILHATTEKKFEKKKGGEEGAIGALLCLIGLIFTRLLLAAAQLVLSWCSV